MGGPCRVGTVNRTTVTMSATIDTWTGRLGLLSGFALVAAWIAVAGSPASVPEPPASMSLGASPSAELEISGIGRKPIVAASNMRADGRVRTGTISVRNLTPASLAFAMRTSYPQRELDRSAWISLADGDETLFRSTLGKSQAWSAKNLHVDSGAERELTVKVWIPKDAPDGWQAARADVRLEFSSTPELMK